jgi:hypothetical protein
MRLFDLISAPKSAWMTSKVYWLVSETEPSRKSQEGNFGNKNVADTCSLTVSVRVKRCFPQLGRTAQSPGWVVRKILRKSSLDIPKLER